MRSMAAPHLTQNVRCGVPLTISLVLTWRGTIVSSTLEDQFNTFGCLETGVPMCILSRIRGFVTNNDGFWIG
jgi:hypothetical protein